MKIEVRACGAQGELLGWIEVPDFIATRATHLDLPMQDGSGRQFEIVRDATVAIHCDRDTAKSFADVVRFASMRERQAPHCDEADAAD
jgi:hypothetical protein